MDSGADLDYVTSIVHGHLQAENHRYPEDKRIELAYEGRFWEGSPFSFLQASFERTGRSPYPHRIQVNRILGFIEAHLSNLFLRAPRAEAKPPGVLDVRPGRRRKLEGLPELVGAVVDEFMSRADVQMLSRYAYQLALTQGLAGFKLGVDAGDTPLISRVWLDVLPRGEILYDDRARDWRRQAYVGHMRWELVRRAEQIVGASIERPDMQALPDVLENPEHTRSSEDRHRVEKYVQVLEFYDLIEEQQRFYIVGPGTSPTVTAIGKVLPMPYKLPTGRPLVPLVPVVLLNVPRFPLRGIPAVRRVYEANADMNLLLTVLANGMRTDAARIGLFNKAKTPNEFIDALRSGVDQTWVGVDKDTDLAALTHVVENPGFSENVHNYWGYLQQIFSDAQGFGDLQGGKQLKYATAREADIVASAGEQSSSELGSRMAIALGHLSEAYLCMVGEELDGSLSVQRGREAETVTKADLAGVWSVTIKDAASTPVKLEKERVAWLQVLPIVQQLVIAASKPAPPAAVAPDAAPTPEPDITPQSRKFAQVALDHTVQLFELPEAMMWSALSLVDDAPEEERPPTREELLAKTERLLPAMVAEEKAKLAAGGPTAPTVPTESTLPPEEV